MYATFTMAWILKANFKVKYRPTQDMKMVCKIKKYIYVDEQSYNVHIKPEGEKGYKKFPPTIWIPG